MKSFIVPTDFSDTSKNAAKYAAQLLAKVPGATIILYNVYDKISSSASKDQISGINNTRKKILEDALNGLKAELSAISSINIECVTEEGDSVVDSIERYVRHNGVDMVIMGITGQNRLEQIFMGSNTLNMVERKICPIMIIPPKAEFTGIDNVMLTSDFKDVNKSFPASPVKKVLDVFKPSLHVVNVDSDHYVELTEEYMSERQKLETMLSNYSPQFYFIRLYDFLDAISQFSTDKKIDFILTVPKNRSFLGGLFKSSHTKKLAYHSHIPIVAIHE